MVFARAIFSVFNFELRRAFSPARIATWLLLAFFPLLLLLASRSIARGALQYEVATIAIYVLVPQITCTLALLLWATPTIQAEIEGQTWVFLLLRPLGRVAAVAGKYLVAVVWAASAGTVAAIACSIASGVDGALQLMVAMVALVFLSSISYGAVYTLIGVLVYRRAMVMAVGFTLGVEVLFSLIPATVNLLTVSYRLRGLLVNWLPLRLPEDSARFFGSVGSSSTHILQLLLYTAIMLFAALCIATRREYPFGSDS